MTKREALVLTLHTETNLCKDFGDFLKFAEEVFGGPIMTHQLGESAFVDRLKELNKEEFYKIMEDTWND